MQEGESHCGERDVQLVCLHPAFSVRHFVCRRHEIAAKMFVHRLPAQSQRACEQAPMGCGAAEAGASKVRLEVNSRHP